ncbi:MAG: bifunctional precorrin-2 dehydrogenase/sirohydrochlorin ferrochelatase [Coriobacteriales bacterium]|jgi:precorrin-2 dehydrogenase/sirohydrochlorin ferrochelatase|nr:bifunctional precorrin-2 dehydrogenase/sirohydrochlorin ferrochelatase [Coriobacteriales bacterium]
MAATYPVALNIAEQPVLVVGGGAVAARKVVGLLSCEATVTVVAARLGDELQELVENGRCKWVARRYQADDLDQATLVFCCTDDPAVNARVSADAKERGLMVNVADCPELCSFYLPSVLRRGSLSIAVSTGGSSPLLARRIRLGLESQFDDDMAAFIDWLRSWRARAHAALPAERREEFWMLATDESFHELIRSGQSGQADAQIRALLDEFASGNAGSSS